MIPNRYHFVWFGRSFPATHAVAIRSVFRHCAPETIHLYLSDTLDGLPEFDLLKRDVPALHIESLAIDHLLHGLADVDADGLRTAWDDLLEHRRYAALSDVLRYLVLLRHGGVYLDLDTITIRDLRPLLGRLPAFCGEELILVPGLLYRQSRFWRRFRTTPLDLLRLICSRVRPGVRWWKRISHWYAPAINGAVLGTPAGHALVREALGRVPTLYREVARRRPVIGPDLIQELAPRCKDIEVLPPAFFYPLGPTMVAHLFRDVDDVERLESEVITPDTLVVHWYNDHQRRNDAQLTREYIEKHSPRQLFSRLARPYL
jgi:hypothetical protein